MFAANTCCFIVAMKPLLYDSNLVQVGMEHNSKKYTVSQSCWFIPYSTVETIFLFADLLFNALPFSGLDVH